MALKDATIFELMIQLQATGFEYRKRKAEKRRRRAPPLQPGRLNANYIGVLILCVCVCDH